MSLNILCTIVFSHLSLENECSYKNHKMNENVSVPVLLTHFA